MSKRIVTLFLEELESRDLLSVGALPADPPLDPAAGHAPLHAPKEVPPKHHPGGSSGGSSTPLNPDWFMPDQIRAAYGFDQIPKVNSTTIDGAGQTIAIIDVYDDPNILSDANTFSSQFGLPQFNQKSNPEGTHSPTFIKLNEDGQDITNVPSDSELVPRTNSAWSSEISLDVEWAHAIAPQANIVLIEANSESTSDVFQAMSLAQGPLEDSSGDSYVANVVSMSWGYNESNSFMGSYMTGYDSTYLPPDHHITFVAATLDNGSHFGVYWPAISPNVVGVGGTVLKLNASGGYGSETGWSKSTGGISKYEPRPSYQDGIVPFGFTTTPTNRMNPDVAYAATNFAAYDTVGTYRGWFQAGGTSAGTPQWAGLIALADQERVVSHKQPLNSTETLTGLYQLANLQFDNPDSYSYFHDITAGNNGYRAGTGYDLVTGIGTPIANNLIPALANYSSLHPAAPSTVSPPAATTTALLPAIVPPAAVPPEVASFANPGGQQVNPLLPGVLLSSDGAMLGHWSMTEGARQYGLDNQASPIDQFWVAYANWLGNDSSWQRDAMTAAGLTARSYFHWREA